VTLSQGQDYGALLEHTRAAGTGVVAIPSWPAAHVGFRQSATRSPDRRRRDWLRASYALDVDEARRLLPLVRGGHAASLAEAARTLCHRPSAAGTDPGRDGDARQFRQSLAAVRKGPLPQAALDRLAELRSGRAG
jgi:hypothetical protein